jgi:hypothetical protein
MSFIQNSSLLELIRIMKHKVDKLSNLLGLAFQEIFLFDGDVLTNSSKFKPDLSLRILHISIR